HGVQRAAPDRDRVRIRAGDETTNASTGDALIRPEHDAAEAQCTLQRQFKSGSRDAIALHQVRNWLDSSAGNVHATSVRLSALAVAGPVREQPRPGARRKALVTADASAPGGAPRSRPPARG